MYDSLKEYCKEKVPFMEAELTLIDKYFELKRLGRKEYLLHDGEICKFLAFVANGTIRHFHVKDGVEKTCDLSFKSSWVTDFKSFTQGDPCVMNLQAMEDSTVFLIRKESQQKLYNDCRQFETFGRLIAEEVAQRATSIAMSLSSDKPEERFQNLIKKQPDIFQRVPQKYIANFLGVSPESLSRIKKRVLTRSKLVKS